MSPVRADAGKLLNEDWSTRYAQKCAKHEVQMTELRADDCVLKDNDNDTQRSPTSVNEGLALQA